MNDQPLTLSKRVKLKPYVPRKFINYEEMNDDEIFNGSGDLVFDCEVFPNFFLAAFKQISTSKVIKLIPPFDTRKLSFILHRYRCIGFNSLKYDIPLLWAAYRNQDTSFLKKVSNALISGTWYSEVAKEFDFQIFKTEHVDLLEVCPNKGSLKLYGARLHTQRIQELPYHHLTELSDFEKEVVTDYCINSDLEATKKIYLFNKDRLELRDYLGKKYGDNLLSKSDAQMAEAIMYKEIKKKTGTAPKRHPITENYHFFYEIPAYLKFASPQLKSLLDEVASTKFTLNDYGYINSGTLKDKQVELREFKSTFGIGGLHSREKNVSYKANDKYLIIDRDVTSYYPRIISNLKLFPEHLGPVFLEVFNDLTERRLHAKERKQFAEDKGLKIAINGISGKFNSEYSIVWSPKCYVQMTLTGQLSILMLVEMLQYNGIQVISANTDGIVIYCKKDRYNDLLYWVKYWEQITNYQTEETQYKAYYARDVNAYFAHKLDNTIKVKGPYSEVGSQTGTQLDNNPIMLICSDAIKKLLSDNIPIEKTITECKDLTRFVTVRNVKGGAHKDGYYLGKVIRYAYFKNEYGTINYIETNNKVPDTDGSLPLMDMPDSFPENLDYDRYIKETINILYDIDYLKRPTQIRFW